MKAWWLFSLFCLLSVPSVTGQTADIITQREVIHALPGTDVTLVCMFPKLHTTHIIQTQWSKTDGSLSTKIAVYHPTYGTHYFKFSAALYNFLVSFNMRRCCSNDYTQSLCSTNPNVTSECNWWTLHLKNVTVSLSGQYECTFATYPYGTKAAKIQLIVKEEGLYFKVTRSFAMNLPLKRRQKTLIQPTSGMDKEEQHYLKKVWLNETLEIPCLEDKTSENSSTYPLKWLVDENGRKEELVTKEPSCPAVYRNSSVLYGQRVLLGFNNALKVYPPKITDDGKVFSCHVLYHPERVQKSSTTVRVFAYPEIFISLQEGSASTSQKPNVSCVVRKAFPKPRLLWYTDRVSLTEQPGEISVVQEDLQDSEGFYELRSTLMLQGTHETHKTFSCACLFHFPWNETRNISSEEIFISFDNKSNEASVEVFTTMVSDEHQSTSVASPDFTSQANLASASTTQGNLSYSITDQIISVTRRRDLFATNSLLNSTGNRRNTEASRFPWPTVVAVLLLFCSSLVALGIRKWCQYQKEIMNRPPSFKPPPPPIKYISMVESDGTPPSCHELANL